MERDRRLLIVKKFLEVDVSVSPEALDIMLIRGHERYLTGIESLGYEVRILRLEHLDAIDRMEEEETRAVSIAPPPKPKGAEYDPEITIEEASEAKCVEGEMEEFVDYFRSRYDRTAELFGESIRKRVKTIARAKAGKRGDHVLIMGMVRRRWQRARRGLALLIEGKTGSIPCFFPPELTRRGESISMDQIVAVKGVANGRGGLNVETILQPDIPADHEPNRAEVALRAVLISDTHIGSKCFSSDYFNRFLRWLKGEEASLVKYLIISGDLVDGIGIYPNQESELEVADIYRQFELAAEYLSMVPEHITILYVPGNHEPVRQAEPQPPVGEEYVAPLMAIGRDIRLLGNPTTLRVHGVRFLLYHGRSLNAIFKHVPGLQPVSTDTVPLAMIELLRARNVAPIYGESPIAPQPIDRLVIAHIPDVFHCGHMHVYGDGNYRGVRVVNSGTFQTETSYMRAMGIEPTPGYVALVNLRTLEVRFKGFSG